MSLAMLVLGTYSSRCSQKLKNSIEGTLVHPWAQLVYKILITFLVLFLSYHFKCLNPLSRPFAPHCTANVWGASANVNRASHDLLSQHTPAAGRARIMPCSLIVFVFTSDFFYVLHNSHAFRAGQCLSCSQEAAHKGRPKS